jgi:hypothetical protein
MGEVMWFVIGLFVSFFLGLLIGVGAGVDSQNDVWKKMTVERGLALHCPDDGVWAWNGECK